MGTCDHPQIVMVYTQGKQLGINKYEKDLLVRCDECDMELYRVSLYKRELINLMPI